MPTADDFRAAEAVVRRLGQMRELWEAAAKEYFEPNRFLLNLQNCITTSRTVTFILQKQKNKVAGFDEWYEPHRKRLASDPIMKWAMEARNSIEKEGDLRTHSQVRGEIIASYYEGPVSPWVPQALYASPQQFYHAVPKAFFEVPHIVENGTLLIERRWVDEQLPQMEVLEALAHVYEELAITVADFCNHLGIEPPAWVLDSKPDVMGELAMDRALYLSMRDGSRVGIRLFKKQKKIDGKALRRRYGDQKAKWERIKKAGSFKELCDAFFQLARFLMAKDGYHHSFTYFLKGMQLVQMIGTDHPDRASRYVMMRDLAKLARLLDADGMMMVGEAWTAKPEDAPSGLAADAKNRGEALWLAATNAKCETYAFTAQIVRKKNKKHKVKRLEPTIVQEKPALWILYPFQRMWGCVDEELMFEAEKRLSDLGVNLDIYAPAEKFTSDAQLNPPDQLEPVQPNLPRLGDRRSDA
ncbi:hypothetical protein CN128_24565 [Sinorhizobium meliloti]|uniref:hypothetical protein n=1 Tax=Rhizobium meliloti TaxID=382 RepID=UPI000FD6DDB7|nr:hypothetical protein [Sinorhizobium meliloti]MDX0139340.1 hypothetical protein [Sinorhizobium meliloti]MDX0382679.1 hypothetical protein [Sinorhizobium meliloti]RVM51432.1 hypothetical protein CN128_24565 [Sinorhizobium meliloti]